MEGFILGFATVQLLWVVWDVSRYGLFFRKNAQVDWKCNCSGYLRDILGRWRYLTVWTNDLNALQVLEALVAYCRGVPPNATFQGVALIMATTVALGLPSQPPFTSCLGRLKDIFKGKREEEILGQLRMEDVAAGAGSPPGAEEGEQEKPHVEQSMGGCTADPLEELVGRTCKYAIACAGNFWVHGFLAVAQVLQATVFREAKLQDILGTPTAVLSGGFFVVWAVWSEVITGRHATLSDGTVAWPYGPIMDWPLKLLFYPVMLGATQGAFWVYHAWLC